MKDIFDSKDEFSAGLAGDILQLSPVKGTPIFKEPTGKKNKEYYQINVIQVYIIYVLVFLEENDDRGLV